MLTKKLTTLFFIFVLLSTAVPVLAQTAEQKAHPKYKELEVHFEAFTNAKDNETFQKEMNIVIGLEQEIFGEPHLKTAEIFFILGTVNLQIEKLDKALDRFKIAVQIREKFLGKNHPDTVKTQQIINALQTKIEKSSGDNTSTTSTPKTDEAYRLNWEGVQLYQAGKYDEAIQKFEASLKLRLTIHDKEHPDTATTYNNIGDAYYNKGEYGKAIEYFNKSLKIRLKTLGEEHPDIAQSYNNIGDVYKNKGENDKAIEYYNRSLKIRLKTLGEEHPDTAIIYNNIGDVYRNKSEYDKAIEYYNRSLKIRLKTLGEEHTYTAGSYNNIGVAYCSKREYDKAIEHLDKALSIILRAIGEEHPYTATTYNNVGDVYKNKGEYDKAIEYYNRSLKIRLKTLGEEHPDTVKTQQIINALQAKIEKNSRDNTSTTSTPETSEADRLNREGVQFYQAGKYDDAIQKFEASLKIRLKTLGEDHIDTAISYYNIGLGYVAKGEFVRGIEYFEKSLKIKIKILGEDHPNVVAIKANISTLKTTITTQKDKKNTQTNKEALLMEHYNVYNDALNQKGDYNTALIEAEKVLELAKEIYGEEDPNYAVCYGNAGLVYKKKGEYHKALKYYDKSLKILLKTVGENHELTAMNYNNIGATYRSLGEIDKAMEYYKKSLGIYIKTVGEMNLDTAMNYSNIGEVLFVKGEYNKSLEYLNKAFNSSKRLGENHPAVKTIKDNLDRVKKYAELELSYQAWQDSKTTETYRTKAKEVFKKEKELFGTLHLKSAGIMNYTGIRYLRVGKYTDAKKAFQIALQIRTKFLGENHPETAISYNNMGEAYRYQGEYDKAIEYLNKSLAIQLKTLEENHLETAISYNNLGLAYVLKGQYEEGIENYNKSLTIQLKLLGENNKYVALLYNNLGAAYLSKGEYDKALKYLQKALDIRLKVLGENTPHTTSSYNNLGGIYHNIGEYDKALEYLTKALSIRLKIHGEKHPDTANSYNSLGMVYDQIEKYDEAINNYKKSLSIRLEILGKNHPDIAGSYNNIGHAYYSKKEYDKAIKYFTKSYTISRKVLGENHLRTVIFYSNLGGIYYSKGEYNKAIDYYKKTIQKLEKTEERDILIGAYTHLKLIYIVNRQIPQAIETLQKTVGLILQSRLHIYGKDKGKFMTRHFHLFKELVELYNQTGQYDKAFKITEKMRGLSLLENFQLQYALKESGVDRKLANDMLKRKGEIESHYSEYSAVLRQGEKGQVYAKSLKDKILTEERELERLDKSLEKSNPLYAKNRKIQIPDIPSLQKQLGEANKTLIEYTLNKDEKGKESLTAFVISKNGFQAISLGTNLDLSLKIQNLRRIISKRPRSRYFILGKTVDNQDILFTTSDLKTEEYSCKNPNETERTSCKTIKKGTEIYRKELQEEKNILQTKDTNHAAKVSWKKFATIEKKTVYTDDVTNDFLPRYLKEIYSICIQPLYDKNLLKTKDILISPDASIYTIPFSALIDKDGKYWNEKVTLSMIHSASIWMKLRESKNRKYSYPIFAMGNPFYSDKYAESKGVRAADMRAVTKSGALSELPLDNLPGSAEEIKYIKKEIYHQENSKHIKERISANKQELRDSFPERKPNYKTVHFSVHGLFFPDAEELNSLALTARGKVEKFNAEALKQYETRHKKKVPEDGFLKMGDVIDLGIKSDLVVMSACETSLGSEKAGEGMVGLPQAFLMAGSQNTLATLWSVDDKGTMEFFKKFYKYYLLQKVSLIANRSLQRTQSRMYAKDNKYKDPYYWSAFVLYGE